MLPYAQQLRPDRIEKVYGISAEYDGGEVDYGLPFEFVDPPPRDEDGNLIDG